MERKFLRLAYFQKSKLLFAMIAQNLRTNFSPYLIETYLFNDITEENIEDYYLLAEFKSDFEITPKLEKYLTNVYETIEGTFLYAFHLVSHKEDVDKFMQGKYSEFSEDTKSKIAFYYNIYSFDERSKTIIKVSKETLLKLRSGPFEMQVILNPSEYIREVAEEMVPLIYEDLGEAINNVINMKEIAKKYDRRKETFTKKIK